MIDEVGLSRPNWGEGVENPFTVFDVMMEGSRVESKNKHRYGLKKRVMVYRALLSTINPNPTSHIKKEPHQRASSKKPPPPHTTSPL